MLKITAYADRLIDDLDDVDYIDRVKTQQRNWIGRSHGAEINFNTTAGDTLTVYTTRADTLFGATYMVISPEHAFIKKWADAGLIRNADAVAAYQEEAARKSDFERTELNKEKTGVVVEGVKGINPVNGKEIPIFISDYVLATYGTGAIMAVPAHDTRDWEFAKKFGLPIIEVVKGTVPSDLDKEAFTDVATGTLVNSDFLNGLSVEDAKNKMYAWLEENGKGHKQVNFKLRDWVFSRQRYWGEPIPMVYCDKCGWVPLPESELPLRLPEIKDFEPGERRRKPAGAPYRVGQHDLPLLRCPRQARDRHYAPVGRFELVLPALLRPEEPRCHRQQGGARVLEPRGLVQRRHGAHHPAPAVQPFLAQVPVRHRRCAHQGAVPEAYLPRHDPGPEPPCL